MIEQSHVMGLGLALVDAKTWAKQYLPLPNENSAWQSLISKETDFSYSIGGIVSNALTAYSRFTGKPVLFLGCVGNDTRGQYYQNYLDPKLGKLQVDSTDLTGVVFHVLDEDGTLLDKRSFYGAAQKVKAPIDPSFDDPPNCFITNAAVFSMPGVFIEVRKVFDNLRKRSDGLFVFNCGGTRPNRTSRELLIQSMHDSEMTPDIVVGNEAEMCYIANNTSYEEALQTLFPNSRIVILTRAEKGSIVKFEGTILPPIPAYPIQSKEKFDGTGAGDCYLGVWLGALSQIPSSKWKREDIVRASHTASYSASSVIAHPTTQLTENDAEKARYFYNNFKV